jgi:tetratricopeptide (TPR) repeat protein
LAATISDAAVKAELRRLMDNDFAREGSTPARLLEYLVSQRLAGNLSALREMVIGIEVFGRDAGTYDPKTDPIVRVSVARLRERLQKHYAMFDAPPAMRIVLPKGHYVPEFVEPGARDIAPPRVLVLPFSSDATDETWSVLLFEATIASMQSLVQLLVLGVRSSRAAAQESPLEAARKVNAQSVLTCRVNRFDGDRLGFSAMLTGAPFGQLIHQERYVQAHDETALAFVERAAQELQEACMTALTDQMPGQYMPPPRRRGVRGIERRAIDWFVESKIAAAQGTAEGHLRAREALEQALAIEPNFAAAHAALAGVMGNLSMYSQVTPEEAWRIGSEASRRAMALDPAEPNAIVNLAADKIFYEFDFHESRTLLNRAVQIAPRFPGGHMLLGTLNSYDGNLEAALLSFDAAHAVDPLFPATRANRVVALYFAGKFEAAIDSALALLDEFPQRSSTRLTLAEAYYHAGDLPSALVHLEQLRFADPDDESAGLFEIVVNHRGKPSDKALETVKRLEQTSQLAQTNPTSYAYAYAQLGDAASAMAMMQRAADSREGGFAESQVNPSLAPLKDNDAFIALLARYKLRPKFAR